MADTPSGSTEVLEHGADVTWSRWVVRAGAAAAVGAALVAAVVVQRSADGDVVLDLRLDASASSTSPPAGRVDYFLVVHNAGAGPVTVEAVEARTSRLEVRDRGDGEAHVPPGGRALVPVSVVLDCTRPAAAPGTGLRAQVRVRREGGTTELEADVERSALVLGVAENLCALRPRLRGLELSGPVEPADP